MERRQRAFDLNEKRRRDGDHRIQSVSDGYVSGCSDTSSDSSPPKPTVRLKPIRQPQGPSKGLSWAAQMNKNYKRMERELIGELALSERVQEEPARPMYKKKPYQPQDTTPCTLDITLDIAEISGTAMHFNLKR